MRVGMVAVALAAAIGILGRQGAAVEADQWYRAPLVRQSIEPPYRTQLDDSIYAPSD